MEPTTLSATAIKAYLDCPAHFNAQYVERIRIASPAGGAGDLGTLVHEVLEWWVTAGRFSSGSSKALGDKCRELAPNYGIVDDLLKQAIKMLFAWYDRWNEAVTGGDRSFEVMMCEIKENFLLKVQDANGVVHQIGVTYIWDRCDQYLDDGSIRIVDYKSWMKSLTADEVFSNSQVRIYALAAAIRFKDLNPPFIWVQLDQLRYGPVQVRFTKEDIRDIWNWLRGVYRSILADPGTRENVGDACRWCVRSPECESFNKAVAAGTVMSYRNPEEAAQKVAEINAVLGALKDTKDQLVAYLESYLEEQQYLEEKFENGVLVKITPKRQRTVNHEDAVAAIGTEIASRYGKLGVGVIDELLEGDELTDEQKESLRKAVTEGVTTSTNAVFKS